MKDVVIYSVDYCPYCKKAEMLLKDKKVAFKKIDITSNEEEYRNKLGEYYDIKGKVTVPQIIIGEKRIGGWDALSKLEKEGRLDEELKD